MPPFKPESIDAYEVGVKADLLDRRLRLNVAGFYYDYTNIQVQKLVQASLYVINGASARIYGVDADFTAIVSDNFTLTGGVNWISPKFESFPDCPVGAPGGGVPRWGTPVARIEAGRLRTPSAAAGRRS